MNKRFKKIRKIFIAVFLFSTIIICRIYLIDLYRVPSSSMLPNVQPGDYILVSKITYGPRVLNVRKLLIKKELGYKWYKGIGSIRKGDIIVFNKPIYPYNLSDNSNIYGNCLVKRCYGLPGEIVRIENTKNRKGVIECFYSMIYPYDTTLHWSLDNYGPLWVPGKGQTMKLDQTNAKNYKDILLFEGYETEIRNDSIFLNGKFAKYYAFNYNYYFMLGDNFYNSTDSRYWGFVPQTHIIGKAMLVLFSIDPNQPWYRSFKWKRFLKRIK